MLYLLRIISVFTINMTQSKISSSFHICNPLVKKKYIINSLLASTLLLKCTDLFEFIIEVLLQALLPHKVSRCFQVFFECQYLCILSSHFNAFENRLISAWKDIELVEGGQSVVTVRSLSVTNQRLLLHLFPMTKSGIIKFSIRISNYELDSKFY